MKNSTHKVVILENLTSPYIHQAIIVLKNYEPINESKVIFEAEKIVDDYLRKTRKTDNDIKIYERRARKKKKPLMGLIVVSCLFLMAAAGTIIISSALH